MKQKLIVDTQEKEKEKSIPLRKSSNHKAKQKEEKKGRLKYKTVRK